MTNDSTPEGILRAAYDRVLDDEAVLRWERYGPSDWSLTIGDNRLSMIRSDEAAEGDHDDTPTDDIVWSIHTRNIDGEWEANTSGGTPTEATQLAEDWILEHATELAER